MITIQERISEAVIRRNQGEQVRQITCTKYPIKFRYRQNRELGSWYLVSYANGKTKWRKIANWPQLNTAKLISLLPNMLAELVLDPDAEKLTVEKFLYAGDLLRWYLDRALTDRNISQSRKRGIQTAIKKHLIPKLDLQEITLLNTELIDEKLLWPLQEKYSVAYLRQIYDVLRIAFNRAKKLKVISHNPLADMKFTDSVKAPIRPKEPRIIPGQLWLVAEQIKDANMLRKMLVTMLLANGTRIGETRQARWDRFDFKRMMWQIPAEETKTGVAHTVPLTKRSWYMLKKYQKWQNKQGYKGVFLFPAAKAKRCITEKQAGNIIRRISQGKWSAHDLRKVARTIWATNGVDADVAEMLLNHRLDKVKSPYINTRMDNLKKQALEKYHNELLIEGFRLLRLANRKI